MRDSRYIEILGSKTHELPLLLVHPAAEVAADTAAELASVMAEAEDMLAASDAGEDVVEQRKFELAVQLAVQYKECLEVRILTDLIARNAASIRTGILSAWEERGKPGPLILDLAGARHIDSSGVSALLAVSQRTEDAGVLLVLRGLRASPRRMLERTGLGVLFHIADTHAPADAA